MNVLMVCHSSPFPPESGATKRMYHLLQEASRRHTVSLIAIGTRGQSEEFIARAGVRCADVRFVEIARSKAERLWRLASGAAVGRSSAWSMHDPSVQQTIDALVALADQTVSKPDTKGVAMWFGGLPVAKPQVIVLCNRMDGFRGWFIGG